MFKEVGGGVTFVELEAYALRLNIEDEFAISAIIDLPSTVMGFQEVIC